MALAYSTQCGRAGDASERAQYTSCFSNTTRCSRRHRSWRKRIKRGFAILVCGEIRRSAWHRTVESIYPLAIPFCKSAQRQGYQDSLLQSAHIVNPRLTVSDLSSFSTDANGKPQGFEISLARVQTFTTITYLLNGSVVPALHSLGNSTFCLVCGIRRSR